MRIKAFYRDVDFLISSINAITIKNKTTAGLFKDIGVPPSVIVTRWSSWLRAVDYYCDNLTEIRKILDEIQEEGVLMSNAKSAVYGENVFSNLCGIKRNYMNLVVILDQFENSAYDIESAFTIVSNISFPADPVGLKQYLKTRLEANEISNINEFSNQKISPSIYCALRRCPPSSISVERSFSMLNKLLAKDRNFLAENVIKYMFFYYNSKVFANEVLESEVLESEIE